MYMDSNGEQTSNQSQKFSRRQFLKGTVGLGLAAVTAALAPGAAPAKSPAQAESLAEAPIDPSVSPLPQAEVLNTSEVKLYNDLTPGIGIGVAWIGRTSTWNPIVENIIKATTGVSIAPYVFVPRYLSEDFNAFIQDNRLKPEQCHVIICDPEYEESSDAAEMDSGKKAPNIKRKGFISSWIRDWGSMVALKGVETVLLNTRKANMPDPLKGVNATSMKTMRIVDPGLKFDGGAFSDFRTNDGRSFFLGSENEFVNNNQWIFRQDLGKTVDSRVEAENRLRSLLGQNLDINLLPSLIGNSVDHTDIYTMPLGDNVISLGQALQDDPNYGILESVREKMAAKNLAVSRVPIRRRGENIISWTNVLPHITQQNRKLLFMPTYDGFEEENDMAEGTYKDLGFEVVRVDATSTADDGGAVHCATNTSITAAFIQGI